MAAGDKKLVVALMFFGFIFFSIFLILQWRDLEAHCIGCGMSNPILRPRIERKEPFQNYDGASVEAPSLLLTDILPAKKAGAVGPTSERCYAADFQQRLERTANFRQMTNNYKRGVPDSCSQPLHDLTTTFYEVEVLPAA
jgi:hypothetical protein